MVHYHIRNDPDAPLMALCHKLLKVIHRAILRINCLIIRNIVFVIAWRWADGHQPDLIAAKICPCRIVSVVYIVQFVNQSLDITDSVSIAVIVGIEEDFIGCSVFVIDNIQRFPVIERIHLRTGDRRLCRSRICRTVRCALRCHAA